MLAMSNGEDVLDNWEEIDEAELTNNLQKLEEERKLREKTNLDKFQETFDSTVETTTKDTTPIVPGTMKLLQRPTQTSVVVPQQLNASDDAASPFDNMQGTFQPVLMVLHKDSDEYQSANYTQPINTQTVKILRRPTQSSEPRNNGVRPKQPIKTLQQREQEYAQARLRILGAAKNPEDDQAANTTQAVNSTTPTSSSSTAAVVTSTTNTNTAPIISTNDSQSKINPSNRSPQQQAKQTQQLQHYGGALNPYNPFYQQQQQQNFYYQNQQQIPQHQNQQPLHHSLSSPSFGGNNRSQFMSAGLLPTPPLMSNMRQQFQQQQQQQQTWSPVVGGSVSSFTLQRQQQRHQQQQQQHQQLDVLRTPRGPDGSNGFQMRLDQMRR